MSTSTAAGVSVDPPSELFPRGARRRGRDPPSTTPPPLAGDPLFERVRDFTIEANDASRRYFVRDDAGPDDAAAYGDDDVDSNAEDHVANDYPDEEDVQFSDSNSEESEDFGIADSALRKRYRGAERKSRGRGVLASRDLDRLAPRRAAVPPSCARPTLQKSVPAVLYPSTPAVRRCKIIDTAFVSAQVGRRYSDDSDDGIVVERMAEPVVPAWARDFPDCTAGGASEEDESEDEGMGSDPLAAAIGKARRAAAR